MTSERGSGEVLAFVTLSEKTELSVRDLVAHRQPGARLPTDREVAASLGVSERTVRTVMGRLAREGVVERVRGSGTFVPRETGDQPPLRDAAPSARDSAATVAGHLAQSIHGGELRIGDQLPQVKALCLSYHVTSATVTRAYRMLVSRGLASKVGRRFFVGSFASTVTPSRPGRVDFYNVTGTDFDRALNMYGMRPAYAKMERELARHGRVIHYRSAEDYERALRRPDAEEPPDGVLLSFMHRGEYRKMVPRVRRLLRHWQPRRVPTLLYGDPPGSRPPPEVAVLSRGNIATVWSRTLARFVVNHGFRDIVFFFDLSHSWPKSLAAHLKMLPEIWHLDESARFRLVVKAPSYMGRLEAFLTECMGEDAVGKPSHTLSKYRQLSVSDLRDSVQLVSSMADAYESVADGRVWLFSRDRDAVEALQYARTRHVAVPSDMAIMGLENDPAYLQCGLSTCVEDWETIGYLMAHAIIGDFVVARTSKGYLRPAALAIQRQTT